MNIWGLGIGDWGLGIFQFFMPLIGWLAVHTAVEYLTSFERFVPWIAFGLLLYIGGKMILEGLNPKEEEKEVEEETAVARGTLLLQGVATSIDALSVGFTVASYNASMAVLSSLIIIITAFGTVLLKFLTNWSNTPTASTEGIALS